MYISFISSHDTIAVFDWLKSSHARFSRGTQEEAKIFLLFLFHFYQWKTLQMQ